MLLFYLKKLNNSCSFYFILFYFIILYLIQFHCFILFFSGFFLFAKNRKWSFQHMPRHPVVLFNYSLTLEGEGPNFCLCETINYFILTILSELIYIDYLMILLWDHTKWWSIRLLQVQKDMGWISVQVCLYYPNELKGY